MEESPQKSQIQGKENEPKTGEVMRNADSSLNEVVGKLGLLVQRQEELSEAVLRMKRPIENAPPSGFNIAAKIAESENFTLMMRQARFLSESAKEVSVFKNKLRDEPELRTSLLNRFAENEQSLQQLMRSIEGLYGTALTYNRKLSNYYDGRQNEDEDFIKRLIGSLRSVFDQCKDIDRVLRTTKNLLK